MSVRHEEPGLKPVHPPDVDVEHAPRRALLLLAGTILMMGPVLKPAVAFGGDPVAFASAIEHGIVTVQVGVISWYGAAFHDKPTASGERFNSDGYTMAHPTLPFGTKVRVTNLRNGRSIVVRVNDRGPHVGSRIADLSRAAAARLGMIKRGVIRARIEVVDDDGAVLVRQN
jgi:rare lipoprotein A